MTEHISGLTDEEVKQTHFREGALIKHFKGGVYRVIALAERESSGDPIVVYKNDSSGRTWTRPLSEFYDRVDYGSLTNVARFEVLEHPRYKMQDITIHMRSGAKLDLRGRYREDLQTTNWHYYETEKGKIFHVRKHDMSYVVSEHM